MPSCTLGPGNLRPCLPRFPVPWALQDGAPHCSLSLPPKRFIVVCPRYPEREYVRSLLLHQRNHVLCAFVFHLASLLVEGDPVPTLTHPARRPQRLLRVRYLRVNPDLGPFPGAPFQLILPAGGDLGVIPGSINLPILLGLSLGSSQVSSASWLTSRAPFSALPLPPALAFGLLWTRAALGRVPLNPTVLAHPTESLAQQWAVVAECPHFPQL